MRRIRIRSGDGGETKAEPAENANAINVDESGAGFEGQFTRK